MPRAKEEQPYQRLRQLYPDLSEEDLPEAGDNLDRYTQVVLRIFESLRNPSRAEQIAELIEHATASDHRSSGTSRRDGRLDLRTRRSPSMTSLRRLPRSPMAI